MYIVQVIILRHRTEICIVYRRKTLFTVLYYSIDWYHISLSYQFKNLNLFSINHLLSYSSPENSCIYYHDCYWNFCLNGIRPIPSYWSMKYPIMSFSKGWNQVLLPTWNGNWYLLITKTCIRYSWTMFNF